MGTTIIILTVILAVAVMIIFLRRRKKIVTYYFYKVEMKKDSTFEEIFTTFLKKYSTNLESICFKGSLSQIRRFVKRKKNWLCKQNLNALLLFKDNGKTFVLCAGINTNGTIKRIVFDFEEESRWNNGVNNNFCIVVPEYSKRVVRDFLEKLVQIRQVTVSPLIP